jgi:hypothetical protein
LRRPVFTAISIFRARPRLQSSLKHVVSLKGMGSLLRSSRECKRFDITPTAACKSLLVFLKMSSGVVRLPNLPLPPQASVFPLPNGYLLSITSSQDALLATQMCVAQPSDPILPCFLRCRCHCNFQPLKQDPHVMLCTLCRFPSIPTIASAESKEATRGYAHAMLWRCNMHLSFRLFCLPGLRSTAGRHIHASRIRST